MLSPFVMIAFSAEVCIMIFYWSQVIRLWSYFDFK